MRNYLSTHYPNFKPLRQKVVVLTGAGISAESGLATFVLDFYNQRRKELLHTIPNQAHHLLAELEQWHDVTIITQNVDDLHERAGSTHVIHLHGELTKVTSSENRLNPECIKQYPLDIPIRKGDKAADGSQLRPFIVWFGEYV